jgi:hypothetical protein
MKQLAAVIVETRPNVNIITAVEERLTLLPSNTDLFIFTCRTNRFLKIVFPKAQIVQMDPISLVEYNRLLASPEFWDIFRYVYFRVYIFQSDGKLLRSGIEYFLDLPFGYYGAPWKFQDHGGNGGESLRDPELMHELAIKYPHDDVTNEDIYFSNLLYHRFPDKLAPRSVCLKWGVETVFTLGSLTTHAPEKWLTEEQCQKIFCQYEK